MAKSKTELLVTANAGRTREVVVSFGLCIGGGRPILLARAAGPEVVKQARAVANAGAHMIRLAATPNPYTGDEPDPGLICQVRAASGLPVAVEVQDSTTAAKLARVADALVVPGPQMQNFSLLKALGRMDAPVMLERGPACTVEEWLMAAEYILAGGNGRVVLIAGPTRSPDGTGGNLLDLCGAVEAKRQSCLPVLADATVAGDHAPAMARAVLALQLDGVGLDGAQVGSVQGLMGLGGLVPGQAAELDTLRAAVDQVDAEILSALAHRLQLARTIGRLKALRGMPVRQPQREQALLEHLLHRARGTVPAEVVHAVWSILLNWSREVQYQIVQAGASGS